jgi:hypothetical protein
MNLISGAKVRISIQYNTSYKIQQKKIAQWSTLTGFKISSLKSQCIIISNKKGQKHLNIQLNNNFISNKNIIKILRVYFDQKINWIQHLKHLKISLTRSLNIMKMISQTTWGGDENTLIRIHRHLIRAKMDYGAPIYQSAKPNHHKIVDTTFNTSITLCPTWTRRTWICKWYERIRIRRIRRSQSCPTYLRRTRICDWQYS